MDIEQANLHQLATEVLYGSHGAQHISQFCNDETADFDVYVKLFIVDVLVTKNKVNVFLFIYVLMLIEIICVKCFGCVEKQYITPLMNYYY